MNRYWLSEYLDERGISDMDRAVRALSDPSEYDVLERVYNEVQAEDSPAQVGRDAIVAGAALDLSGALDCGDFGCLQRRVDELFVRMWHYFDAVVAVGASGSILEHYKFNPDIGREMLLEHVKTLLYIRDLGAENLIVFDERPHYCVHQLPEVAAGLGVSRIFEIRDQVVSAAVEGKDFFVEPPVFDGNAWHFVMRTPWGSIAMSSLEATGPEAAKELGGRSMTDLRKELGEDLFHTLADHFAGDLLQANRLRAPLAVAQPTHAQWLQAATSGVPDASDVALAMELPVLHGIPVRELISLRQNEGEHFEAFRGALRRAINERVGAGEDASSSEVAQEIVRDVVDPALADIGRRLSTAQSALAKKTSTRLVLGATTTVAGLVTGLPLLAVAGIPFIGSALMPADKYFDERRDVELSDMYFLWQAAQRAPVL